MAEAVAVPTRLFGRNKRFGSLIVPSTCEERHMRRHTRVGHMRNKFVSRHLGKSYEGNCGPGINCHVEAVGVDGTGIQTAEARSLCASVAVACIRLRP